MSTSDPDVPLDVPLDVLLDVPLDVPLDGQVIHLKRSEGMRLPRINSWRVWLGRMQRYRLRCVFTYSPNTRPVRIAWLGFEVDYKVSRFK